MSSDLAPGGLAPEAALALRLLAARRERDSLLGSTLFGEPAWEIMLRLFAAHGKGASVPVSDLAAAANLPAGVGLRWLSAMEEAGKLTLVPGEREAEVRLTQEALGQMQCLLRSWCQTAPLLSDGARG